MGRNATVENDNPKKITRTFVTGYIYKISKIDGNNIIVIDESFKTEKPITIGQINRMSKEHGAQVIFTLKEKLTSKYEMSEVDFVKAAKQIN